MLTYRPLALARLDAASAQQDLSLVLHNAPHDHLGVVVVDVAAFGLAADVPPICFFVPLVPVLLSNVDQPQGAAALPAGRSGVQIAPSPEALGLHACMHA